MKRIHTSIRLACVLALLSTLPTVFYATYCSWQNSQSVLQARILACEQFSQLCSLHIKNDNTAILRDISEQHIKRDASLSGIRIVQLNGGVICEAGFGFLGRPVNDNNESQPTIKATLNRKNRPWATLEFLYEKSAYGNSEMQLFSVMALAFLINLLLFAFTLRRSLSVLDTTRVIPTRVRNTLDTIPDGVAVTDANGRIIVVNKAFQEKCNETSQELIGFGLNRFPFQSPQGDIPWNSPDKKTETITGVKLTLKQAHQSKIFNVSCSPIFDMAEKHAGNLISFQDITELENQKKMLECALRDLEESRERLSERNAQLQELASKDMLTGVFNRRYLFENLDQTWNNCLKDNKAMAVFMLDVDKFKLLNDQHGHAVGDKVLKDVAAVLKSSIAAYGMVARYGGEEFCAVLPNMNSLQAMAVAEKVRQEIETQLQIPYHVTASFGVSTTEFGASSVSQLLEQADQSLYSAKHGGRNRVCCWNTEVSLESSLTDASNIPATPESSAAQEPSAHASTSAEIASDMQPIIDELNRISSLMAQSKSDELDLRTKVAGT